MPPQSVLRWRGVCGAWPTSAADLPRNGGTARHTTTPRDPRIRHQRSDGYGASYARGNEEARRANGFVLRFAGVHHGGAEDTEKRTES